MYCILYQSEYTKTPNIPSYGKNLHSKRHAINFEKRMHRIMKAYLKKNAQQRKSYYQILLSFKAPLHYLPLPLSHYPFIYKRN